MALIKNSLGSIFTGTSSFNVTSFLLNRALSLLNDTAEKRYFNLFTERPNLIKEIPLKYIASYIGVTPQSLSRIRKKIT